MCIRDSPKGVAVSGELVLDSLYAPGRADRRTRVKLKLRQDAEAYVTGHTARETLRVSFFNGKKNVEFTLASGLTMVDKANLRTRFPVGTRVTFSFRSLHDTGVPKEVKYERVRPDADVAAPAEGARTPKVSSGARTPPTKTTKRSARQKPDD